VNSDVKVPDRWNIDKIDPKKKIPRAKEVTKPKELNKTEKATLKKVAETDQKMIKRASETAAGGNANERTVDWLSEGEEASYLPPLKQQSDADRSAPANSNFRSDAFKANGKVNAGKNKKLKLKSCLKK